MVGQDEFWSLAQDLLGDEQAEAPPQEQVQSQQAPYEEQSVQVEATAQRASIGSPGLIVGVVFVGILLLSSLVAVVIWNFSDYDPNDLDGDGVANGLDDCFDGFDEWTSVESLDHDRDGCHDGKEDDDDDNDTVPDDADACPTGGIDWLPAAETDNDADGCHDVMEDNDDDNDNVSDDLDAFPLDANEWQDTDGDGVGDNGDAFPEDPSEQLDTDGDGWGDNSDLFPQNGSEWSDVDGDGIGDNADPDDDNDGTPDEIDANPGKDVGVIVHLVNFTLLDQVDWFSNEGTIIICISINNGTEICRPESMTEGSLIVEIDKTAPLDYYHFHNLDESLRYHWIQLSAYDVDLFVNDELDINQAPDLLRFTTVYDSHNPDSNLTFVGVGDGDGDRGMLEFALLPIDYLEMTSIEFVWTVNMFPHYMVVEVPYEDYIQYRLMDHSIDWSMASSHADVISQYAAFATPSDATIMAIADELRSMATERGITSDLDFLRFVYAFVGWIPYAYDIDSTNYTEYPKYPLEMIYDRSGDCEDSSILYISLVEYLGYDAALMLGSVKATEDDDWGGHAWPVVALDNHTGWSVNGVGEKSNLSYYFVESTGYHDGSSDIGVNPWYEIANATFYDVEE
jgi:ferredoxin